MMFSPESGQLDQFNNKLEFTPTIGSNNFSEKGDELINISNDNIIYGEEEFNLNSSRSSLDESNKSYCGIK